MSAQPTPAATSSDNTKKPRRRNRTRRRQADTKDPAENSKSEQNAPTKSEKAKTSQRRQGAPRNKSEVKAMLEASDVKFVRTYSPDLYGLPRSKTCSLKYFVQSCLRPDNVKPDQPWGLSMPAAHLVIGPQHTIPENNGLGFEIGFADCQLQPALSTLKALPFRPGHAAVVCDSVLYGRPGFELPAPRTVLKNMLNKLKEQGLSMLTGFEYEMYMRQIHCEDDVKGPGLSYTQDKHSNQPVFQGMPYCTAFSNDFKPELLDDMMLSFIEMGIDITNFHAEYGPGQFEVNFEPSKGIDAADKAFLFKVSAKEIALKHKFALSFMTKPYVDSDASGGHTHFSLWTLDNKNAMIDPEGKFGLSDIGRYFIAGILKHLPSALAFFNPTINCYKRFQPNSFSPLLPNWGVDNRTVALRLLPFGNHPRKFHAENRMPTAASNPYLVLSTMIACGLLGIKHQYDLPPICEGDMQTDPSSKSYEPLPLNLAAALDNLEKDSELKAMLGESFVKTYITVKRDECVRAKQGIPEMDKSDKWRTVNNDWEANEYYQYL